MTFTELWVITFPLPERFIQQGYTWLDDTERARADALIDPTVRNRFIACRAVLRQKLAMYMKCKPADLGVSYGDAGKPMIAGSPKSFNITHSGDYGVIAISDATAVGVDIELKKSRRNLAGMGRLVFHPDEMTALDGAEGDRKISVFFDIWVRKEAVVKMFGDSVFQSRNILVLPALTAPGTISISRRGDCWVLPVKISSQYSGAVAIASTDPERVPITRVREWTPPD